MMFSRRGDEASCREVSRALQAYLDGHVDEVTARRALATSRRADGAASRHRCTPTSKRPVPHGARRGIAAGGPFARVRPPTGRGGASPRQRATSVTKEGAQEG